MQPGPALSTWGWTPAEAVEIPRESSFNRLWRAFLDARIITGVVLLALLGVLPALGLASSISGWKVGMCAAYAATALAVRLFVKAPAPGRTFDPHWVSTIGLDLVTFSTLHFLQVAGLNFSPLFALPVLTASVLGSTLLALATAAAVALMLLVDAWLTVLELPGETAQRFLQAGLSGGGYFAVALLGHQLAARLAREESAAQRSRMAVRTHAHVNELIIDTLSQGVIVVGGDCRVHAANPAARQLLGWEVRQTPPSLILPSHPGWQPLAELAQKTFIDRTGQEGEVALPHGSRERLRLHVQTRLTPPHDLRSESLCVMFLEDLREAEARVRTEKLAAMGRMSAAVAHEIRNPLAAITQANALLEEELAEPTQKRLSGMVRQNAQRLAHIVDEILNLARVQQQGSATAWVDLDATVRTLCTEWARQMNVDGEVAIRLDAGGAWAGFDPEHLRRVLVNLLDNALRYISHTPDAIIVTTEREGDGARLCVWSDGAALDPVVQRHLFEPFFSSQSRSSGLGLYICRELCERHGAVIGYRRSPSPLRDGREGNEFHVVLRTRARPPSAPFDTIGA